MSWSFGDPIGWVVGCLVFGFFSLVLGGLVYGVSFRLASMGSLDEVRQASRRPSVVLGCLMAIGDFLCTVCHVPQRILAARIP